MKTPEEYLFSNGVLERDFDGWWKYAKINSLEAIEQAQIDAYNQAIDDAAENAYNEYSFFDSMVIVNKESILKLKK